MIEIKKGEGNAIAVIDAQNDFFLKDGALPVAGIPGEASVKTIIKNIRRLFLDLPFDYRVVSVDVHPKDKHIEYDIFGGKHCVKGTPGRAYHKDLIDVYNSAMVILFKGLHPALVAYSIALGPYFGNHIEDLRRIGIKRIFLAGLAFDYCVGESAIAYKCQGFEVYIVRDATRSVAPPFNQTKEMNNKLAAYGVNIISMKDIKF